MFWKEIEDLMEEAEQFKKIEKYLQLFFEK